MPFPVGGLNHPILLLYFICFFSLKIASYSSSSPSLINYTHHSLYLSLSHLLFFLHCILNRRTPSVPLTLLSSIFLSVWVFCVYFSGEYKDCFSFCCFHGGLAKGFLQSLLAFCPPLIIGKKTLFFSYYDLSWRWAYCQLSSVGFSLLNPCDALIPGFSLTLIRISRV